MATASLFLRKKLALVGGYSSIDKTTAAYWVRQTVKDTLEKINFVLKIKLIYILKILGVKKLLKIPGVKKNFFKKSGVKKFFYKRKIIIMCGCPGTGKTTIARRIHQVMNGTSVIIHRDSLRDIHLGKGVFYPDSDVLPAQLKRIDREVLEYAKKQLYKYDIIILDASFRFSSAREMVYKFAKKRHCEVVIIHCTCNDKISEQRLKEQIGRGEKTFSLARPLERILEYYRKTFEEPQNGSESAVATIITVNTGQNPVTPTAPREKLSGFAKQLIQILEFSSLC